MVTLSSPLSSHLIVTCLILHWPRPGLVSLLSSSTSDGRAGAAATSLGQLPLSPLSRIGGRSSVCPGSWLTSLTINRHFELLPATGGSSPQPPCAAYFDPLSPALSCSLSPVRVSLSLNLPSPALPSLMSSDQGLTQSDPGVGKPQTEISNHHHP